MSATPTMPAGAKAMMDAWQKTAASAAESLARDPRTLAFGSAMMQAHLHFVRSLSGFGEAWMALAPHAAGKRSDA